MNLRAFVRQMLCRKPWRARLLPSRLAVGRKGNEAARREARPPNAPLRPCFLQSIRQRKGTSALVLFLLLLFLLFGYMALPVLKVRSVVARWHKQGGYPGFVNTDMDGFTLSVRIPASVAPCKEMGEPDHAAHLLKFYIQMPDFLAPHKDTAWQLLPTCGVSAVPVAISFFADRDGNVRARAISVCGNIGPAATEAVPFLALALADSDQWVRLAAATSLGKIGVGAKQAVPALVKAIHDPIPAVRQEAIAAVIQIGTDSEEISSCFAEALRGVNKQERISAVYLLGKAGSKMRASVPLLLGMLDDIDVRDAAVFALGECGPNARDAIQPLERLLGDASPVVSTYAAMSLIRIVPDSEKALSTIMRRVADKDSDVRRVAAEALGYIAARDPSKVADLRQMLKDSSWAVRGSAVGALGRIGPPAGAVLPDLIRMMKEEKNQEDRDVIILAIGRIGRGRSDVISIFVKDLSDGKNVGACAAALGEMGSEGREAVPELINALRGTTPPASGGGRFTLATGQGHIVEALGEIGPAAKDAIPVLEDILKTGDKFLKMKADEALRKIRVPAVASGSSGGRDTELPKAGGEGP